MCKSFKLKLTVGGMCCCRPWRGCNAFAPANQIYRNFSFWNAGSHRNVKNLISGHKIFKNHRNSITPEAPDGQPENMTFVANYLWPKAITYTALLVAGARGFCFFYRGRALRVGVESSKFRLSVISIGKQNFPVQPHLNFNQSFKYWIYALDTNGWRYVFICLSFE